MTQTPDPPLLYLIDGHAQIFRAYYAIRGGLSSPVTGEPTNAVFAFAAMMLKLFGEHRPPYVAMAIDMPGKTFRDELYEDYKANREAAPEDLAPQIERIFQMVRLFGVPLLGVAGAEADDVIATVTQRLLDDPQCGDLTIRMLSKDKDLEQLLNDRVVLYDIHTESTIDTAWLKENRGITPDQVIDLLTLTGDKVDNVPGVEGVGPKTAAKLIGDFGSIEGIYDNIDKIKGKRRENLESAHDALPLSRTLVTLKRNVVIDFELNQAAIGPIDIAGLRNLFTEMGFRRHVSDLDRLAQQLPAEVMAGGGAAQLAIAASPDHGPSSTQETSAPPPPPPGPDTDDDGFAKDLFGGGGETATTSAEPDANLTTAAQYEYTAVTTAEQLRQLVDDLHRAPIISVDTETIGLGAKAKLCGICFAWEPGKGVYVPVQSPNPADHLNEATVLVALRPILEDAGAPKCGHNLKYDWLVLRRAGVKLRGIAFDTMIAAFLLARPSLGLDNLARSILGHQMIAIGQLLGPGEKGHEQKTMDQIPLEQITPYAAEDADITLRLYQEISPQLGSLAMRELCDKVEMPLVEVLGEMQFNGIKVDRAVLAEQKKELAAKIDELRDDIYELVGEPFNLDSPKQLSQILFTQLKLPVIKKTKTGASTDAEVLDKLCDLEDADVPGTAVPRLILEYRQFAKLVSTYLGNLAASVDDQTGRVHASFHQAGAATGRLSSSGPNLQNIPVRTDVGRQIRKAFVAEPGHVLISADYSQIELRILAHLSEDPALIDAFEKDMDIHTAVAAQVYGVSAEQVTPQQRNGAKVINFGIIYGVTAYGLARRIEGLDVDGAKELIDDYRRRFAGIDRFLQQCVQQALDDGYVSTIMGRRRTIAQIHSSNGSTRALGERLAINSVVQGSAADLIKIAMVNLHRRIEQDGLSATLLLQIHDELVVEAPQADAKPQAALVKQEMESAMTLRVPLKVDVGIGPNWLDAK